MSPPNVSDFVDDEPTGDTQWAIHLYTTAQAFLNEPVMGYFRGHVGHTSTSISLLYPKYLRQRTAANHLLEISSLAYACSTPMRAQQFLVGEYLRGGEYTPPTELVDVVSQDIRQVFRLAQSTMWKWCTLLILPHTKIAIRYASKVLMSRWPELEDRILSNEHFNIQHVISYARYVICGRWADGEQAILKHIMVPSNRDKATVAGVFDYVAHVIGSRWIEVERVIKPFKNIWRTYNNRFVAGREPTTHMNHTNNKDTYGIRKSSTGNRRGVRNGRRTG